MGVWERYRRNGTNSFLMIWVLKKMTSNDFIHHWTKFLLACFYDGTIIFLLIYFEKKIDICDYHQFFYIKWFLILFISSFTGNITKAGVFMEMIQTFWSFILIDLLQQNMPSSFSSGSTPEKFVPGKKQSFSIIFHYFILTLIFSTWFRGNFIQSQQTAKWRCNSNQKNNG